MLTMRSSFAGSEMVSVGSCGVPASSAATVSVSASECSGAGGVSFSVMIPAFAPPRIAGRAPRLDTLSPDPSG